MMVEKENEIASERNQYFFGELGVIIMSTDLSSDFPSTK
jgi:hypothetical protein